MTKNNEASADATDVTHWVLGYGSLIQQASRVKDAKAALTALPVEARNLLRAWNHAPDYGPPACSFLGVRHETGAVCNGVLFAAVGNDLAALDRRESGYERLEIPRRDLRVLVDESELPAGAVRFWVYGCSAKREPSEDLPFTQSYVDVCLSGCFEIEDADPELKGFARDFVTQTTGWNRHWVNDRLFPRAPSRTVPYASRIDRLLQETVPEAFAGRHFGP